MESKTTPEKTRVADGIEGIVDEMFQQLTEGYEPIRRGTQGSLARLSQGLSELEKTLREL